MTRRGEGAGTTRRRRRRLLLVAVAVATSAVATTAAPTPAQAPDLPVVTIGVPVAPQVASYVDCEGEVQVEVVVDGFAVINRDDIGATDPAPVDVGLSYSGDLADDLVDPQTSVQATSDARYDALTFHVPPAMAGTLTITLEPGPGYTVGDPGSGTVEIDGTAAEVADCGDPLGLPASVTDQTIAVGERPADLGDPGEEMGYVVVGSLPPGLTLDRGRWAGAATTPGTTTFEVRHCGVVLLPPASFDEPVCDGSADVRIVVEAAPSPSSPTAPPATAVTAAAALTG